MLWTSHHFFLMRPWVNTSVVPVIVVLPHPYNTLTLPQQIQLSHFPQTLNFRNTHGPGQHSTRLERPLPCRGSSRTTYRRARLPVPRLQSGVGGFGTFPPTQPRAPRVLTCPLLAAHAPPPSSSSCPSYRPDSSLPPRLPQVVTHLSPRALPG